MAFTCGAWQSLFVVVTFGTEDQRRQFLPRTGTQYADVVELLKTQSINLNYPQGKALEWARLKAEDLPDRVSAA